MNALRYLLLIIYSSVLCIGIQGILFSQVIGERNFGIIHISFEMSTRCRQSQTKRRIPTQTVKWLLVEEKDTELAKDELRSSKESKRLLCSEDSNNKHYRFHSEWRKNKKISKSMVWCSKDWKVNMLLSSLLKIEGKEIDKEKGIDNGHTHYWKKDWMFSWRIVHIVRSSIIMLH